MLKDLGAFTVILLLLSFSQWAVSKPMKLENQEKEPYKIVLIAGPNDHCPHEVPCHKYIQDMQLIRDGLRQISNETNLDVQVELYVAERPPIGALGDVDAVAIHSSGDNTEYEWHAIFPQLRNEELYTDPEYQEWLQYFDEQMDRGMGLAVFHYATFIDHPEARSRYGKWIGGYYEDGVSEVNGDFSTPGSTAEEAVALAGSGHQILNGVTPWSSEAEYYYRIHFEEGPSKPTPLLTSQLPVNDPEQETIAWALERADGGRGVGFTGVHSHENLYMHDFRRFVLNAVMWTAGAEIPEGGYTTAVSKDYIK